MIKIKNRNKTDQYHAFLFSRLCHLNIYYRNKIRSYLATNNRQFIIFFNIIGLFIGMGCSNRATLELETSQTSKDQRCTEDPEANVVEVLTVESVEEDTHGRNSNVWKYLGKSFMDFLESCEKKLVLYAISNTLEHYTITNLKKVHASEISDRCYICLCSGLTEDWYNLICCNKNVDKKCLKRYILYLYLNHLELSGRPLCCSQSQNLWNNLRASTRKVAVEAKAEVEKQKQNRKVEKIKHKILAITNSEAPEKFSIEGICYSEGDHTSPVFYKVQCCEQKLCLDCIASYARCRYLRRRSRSILERFKVMKYPCPICRTSDVLPKPASK